MLATPADGRLFELLEGSCVVGHGRTRSRLRLHAVRRFSAGRRMMRRSLRNEALRGPAPLLSASLFVALGATSALLTACGGSDTTSNVAAKEKTAERTAEVRYADLARCLREHGVHVAATSQPGLWREPQDRPRPRWRRGRRGSTAGLRPLPTHAQESQRLPAADGRTGGSRAQVRQVHAQPWRAEASPTRRSSPDPGGNQEAYLPGVNPGAPAVQAAAKHCGGGPKGP